MMCEELKDRVDSQTLKNTGEGLLDELGEFGPYLPWDRLRKRYADILDGIRSVLEALQSRIRELEAEPRYLDAEWIDARKDPPRPGEEFLGYYENKTVPGKGCIIASRVSTRKTGLPVADDYLWDISGQKIGTDVTHWMPLPEKPKEESWKR